MILYDIILWGLPGPTLQNFRQFNKLLPAPDRDPEPLHWIKTNDTIFLSMIWFLIWQYCGCTPYKRFFKQFNNLLPAPDLDPEPLHWIQGKGMLIIHMIWVFLNWAGSDLSHHRNPHLIKWKDRPQTLPFLEMGWHWVTRSPKPSLKKSYIL